MTRSLKIMLKSKLNQSTKGNELTRLLLTKHLSPRKVTKHTFLLQLEVLHRAVVFDSKDLILFLLYRNGLSGNLAGI